MTSLKVYSVSGKSMSPYLGEYDQVFVKEKSPEVGQIVLLQENLSQSSIVHRFLGNSRFKGDRVTEDDQQIAPLGVVVARQRGDRLVPLENAFTRYCGRWIAILSSLNSGDGIERRAFTLILVVSLYIQRKIEDIFLSENK